MYLSISFPVTDGKKSDCVHTIIVYNYCTERNSDHFKLDYSNIVLSKTFAKFHE